MDLVLSPASLSAARGGFDRLVEAVAAAEGAFRRLASGLAMGPGDPARGNALLDDAVRLERERHRLIGEGNRAYRDRGDLVAGIADSQAGAAEKSKDVWEGFGDRLASTFAGLFERIVRDGRLKFETLFRGLAPLVSDLLGRITGFDFKPILDAVGGLLGKSFGGHGGLGQILSAATGVLGSLFGGGLAGPATGALGALLPIPGASLITAAFPLVAGLFADKDYPFAVAGIGASGGSLVTSASALDRGPIDVVTRLGEQVARTLQAFFDGIGGSVGDISKLTAIGYASGRKSTLPKGFFAGVDDTRGADFATGAVFTGLAGSDEAVLRAVQAGLLRAFGREQVAGVAARDAETVTVGLRRAVGTTFTSLEDGLADIEFLRDFGRTVARLNASGDPAALQRLDIADRADGQGRDDAERIRAFLEHATRLFAPLGEPDDRLGEAGTASVAADEPAFEYDEGRRIPIDGPYRRPITDEGRIVGYEEPPLGEPGGGDPSTIVQPAVSDDDIAAERLAEARAAIEQYVQSLLGLGEAASDTRPLTGYALQLAEAEARLDGLSAALREAGYSAGEAAELIEQGRDAARDRLRGAFEDDLARDLRGARGLGVVDQVSALVEARDIRRTEGEALGADLAGLDALLRVQVEGLVAAGEFSVTALAALREAFADDAIVTDALSRALAGQTAAANDNAAAQLTLADVTRLATRELDAQIREQEQVKRSAEAVVEAIADTRRRLALDGSLSILSPAEQLDEARRHFEGLAGRALAGDQDAQAELPDAGEAYLKLARDFYASNEDYARIFRQVDAALRGTGEVADRQLQVAEQQLEELREVRRALTGELGDLPNPGADFGANPTRNRIIARITGYAGDFGGGGFGAFRTGLSPEINALVDAIAAAINFADGGIMTGGGPLELHRYASGGVARRPQLALFGEGRMPEAFVPLPDGRSIPVTVTAPANDAGRSGPDTGAERRTAGIETLVEETRRLRTDLAAMRAENAALRRGLERLVAGIGTGRAA